MTLLKTKTLPLKAGVDTSDATATAADILLGKTAYTADGKVTGTYNKLQQLVGGSITTITAEDLAGAVSIRSNAFRGLSSLVNIEFPDTLTTIGAGAFYECQNLESRIVIPGGNTTIGNYTFYRCFKVSEIVVSEGVSSIGYGAIQECTTITSITLPSTIASIGGNALYGCTALTGITILATIPPTLESVSAFQNTNNCPIYVPAESLTAYKTATNWSAIASRIFPIPSEGLAYSVSSNEATITGIGTCTDTAIAIPSSIEGNPVKYIGNSSFTSNNSITSLFVPSSVISIGQHSFYSCQYITSLTLSEGLVTIGDYAFTVCQRIAGELKIPNTVTSIGIAAVLQNGQITSIDIGTGISQIKDQAFKNCTSLTGITIRATVPPTLDNADAFDSTNDCPIYVPADSVTAYQTATNWASLASRIQAIQ